MVSRFCLFVLMIFVAILFAFVGTNRNSYNFPTPPAVGIDGPRPMAIFELLDFIVNEVCYVRIFHLNSSANSTLNPVSVFANSLVTFSYCPCLSVNIIYVVFFYYLHFLQEGP